MPNRARRGALLRRWAAPTAGVVLAFVLAMAAWVVVRGSMAQSALDRAEPALERVISFVHGIDEEVLFSGQIEGIAAAREDIDEIAARAGEASGLMSDPVWRLSELLPGIGESLRVARESADALEDLFAGAVAPLATAAEAAEADDGGIVETVGALRGPLGVMAEATDRTLERVESHDVDGLHTAVGERVVRLREELSLLRPVVRSADEIAQIAGSLAGLDGRTRILVMLQNNAELRAGGGLTGTFFEVETADGDLRIRASADSDGFRASPAPVVALPEDVRGLYGDVAGRHVQNITMTDDFALSGELASAWWVRQGGAPPDAVVSIDTGALAALLDVVGPVDVDGVVIDGANLTDTLLRDPYLTRDAEGQTAFFGAVAETIVDRALADAAALPTLGETFVPLVEAGRIAVWSADPADQGVLAETALGGMRARTTLAGAEGYGVSLTNTSGSKLDVSLEATFTAAVVECRPDGRGVVRVNVAFTSTVPEGFVGPQRMAPGLGGTDPEDIALQAAVSGPPGAVPEGVTLDGVPAASIRVHARDRPVMSSRVTVDPGQTREIEFRFVSATAGDIAPRVVHTPLVSDAKTWTEGATCR